MPSPLAPTKRYVAPEVTKTYWAANVADINTGVRNEMEAGVDLTGEIAAMAGWEISADRVPTPDLASKRTGRITGRINPGDASITFHASETTADIRDVLERGDRGYIFILDGGDVPNRKMRVFKVEVAAITPNIDVAASENSRIVVAFSIEDWAEKVANPALT